MKVPSSLYYIVKNNCGSVELESLPTSMSHILLRTFESIATEHVICAGKLVLALSFYYSKAIFCYVLTKSFNFWKHGILIVMRIYVLTAYLSLDT